MTNSFQQEIFGQLFELQKLSFNQLLDSQNTLENSLQKQISSTNLSNTSHSSQQETIFAKSHKNPKQTQYQNSNIKQYSQKQSSCSSTSISNQNTPNSFHQLKNIFNSHSSLCYLCKNNKKNNLSCKICSGTGIIKANSKIAKFMQYIMEFKCGRIPSYKHQQKQQINKNIHFHSQIIPKSTPNLTTHEGYKCNGCQVEPIIGVRYHCPHPCCNDDYDLCQNCFSKLNHHHELQQFGYNLIQEKLQKIKAKMFKPCNKNNKSNKVF